VAMPKLTIKELKNLKLDSKFKKEKTKYLRKEKSDFSLKGETKEQINEKKLVKSFERINVIELKNEDIRKKFELEHLEKNKRVEKIERNRKKEKVKRNKNIRKIKRANVLDLIKNLGSKKVKTIKQKRGRSTLGDNSKLKIGRKNRKIIKNLLIEGNKISKGDNLVEGNTLSKEEKGKEIYEYGIKVKNAVMEFWKLPEYLKNIDDIRCKVQIFVSKDGNLKRRHIIKSSEISEFDKRALYAVDRATPFPPVPFKIRDEVLNGAIELAFPFH
jgi:TonB family protein